MKPGLALASLAGVLAAGGVQAAPPLPATGVFIFSSLCMEPQSGDYRGFRLKLIRKKGGDSALYEYGVGLLAGPVTVKAVDFEGATFEGWVKTIDGEGPIEGPLDSEGGMLKALGKPPVRVSRIADMDEPAPVCPP